MNTDKYIKENLQNIDSNVFFISSILMRSEAYIMHARYYWCFL